MFMKLYYKENVLTVLNRGDYVEIETHNGQDVYGCRWWYRGGVRFKDHLYKPLAPRIPQAYNTKLGGGK